MVTITKDSYPRIKKIAYKYFGKYHKIGSDWMSGGGFSLDVGFLFIRREIGGVHIFKEGIDVDIYDKSYLPEIKKICEIIEKKEKIQINIELKEG